MERLTCYESILYQLLVFNYATKKSLLLLEKYGIEISEV